MAGAIVLIGPMGSGKTTLGKKLAKELGLLFIDTDKQIAGKYGPIAKLFEEHGEEFFRDLETQYLREALEQPAVVATGGGAILRSENQEMISKHHVIFLDTSAEHVIGKVNMHKRPLLRDNPERWREGSRSWRFGRRPGSFIDWFGKKRAPARISNSDPRFAGPPFRL